MGNNSRFTVRRAKLSERDAVVQVANKAFTRPEGPQRDFLRSHPYLWHRGRVREHFVCLEKGQILGLAGLYAFDVRVRGVVFRAAGVGQVCTLQEARGRGVMTAVLRAVCRDIQRQGYEFVWLGGDRLRYSRFGWAAGGLTLRFEMFERYLPPPPDPSRVRPLNWERDFPMVRDHLAALPDVVLMPEDELRMLLDGQQICGWATDKAFIVCREDTVYFASGPEEEIAALLSYHQRNQKESTGGQRWKAVVECSATPSPLLNVCQRHYWQMIVRPSDMLRVGVLVPFLRKACQVAQPGLSAGTGHLSLVNSETGEEATIVCRRGKLSVESRARRDAYRLDTAHLSEVCFSLCPLDVLLPGLPPDSFVRRVFPVPVHWARFFAV